MILCVRETDFLAKDSRSQKYLLNDIYLNVRKHVFTLNTTPDELSYEKVEKVVGEEDGRDEKNCCCPIAH